MSDNGEPGNLGVAHLLRAVTVEFGTRLGLNSAGTTAVIDRLDTFDPAGRETVRRFLTAAHTVFAPQADA
ncbi:hypothetical protein ACTVZO_12710 [Streptomyces sp. IBSNAI002]|uniref:hypothetical protein n=1 Tax=Streptomyces sp. IBSNAI002 TaxID=3457500 RepID=UPI003FD19172